MSATVSRPRRAATPRLGRAEEFELAARAAAGDRPARDRLVEANLGLVTTIAMRFRGRGLEMDDLIGEGRLALLLAASKFDRSYGTRFSTYAGHCIGSGLRSAIAAKSQMIRVPAWLVTILARWRRAEQVLRGELGRPPEFAEVAEALGLNPAQRELVSRAREAARLRLAGGDDDEAADGWLAEVVDARAGAGRLEAEDDRDRLRRRLDQLDRRARAIVAMRYGLDGAEPVSLREAGRRMGLSYETVRQVEMLALARLR